MTVSSEQVGWAAATSAVAHVFVDEGLDEQLTIDGRDGHHLARVRRLRVGEFVTAADGFGRWREYVVASVDRDVVALAAQSDTRREPDLEPTLAVAFALTKGEKPETVVTRLTELGVDRVIPVAATRSVVRWDAKRAATAVERLEIVAREAAMQSRRSKQTVVDAPVPLLTLAGHPGAVVADREGDPVAALAEPGPEGWLLVVGPEGGLTEEELEAFGSAPRLGVGPYVLRAETAAVAGAAALTTRRHFSEMLGEGHGG
ncbi:MAG: 16S rRNA (uracil(1498)-N(3))-methyltransferase [Acidimicrobiia bacterium]|nr:16S rRNA (uracil(1498)-N(3))-methyltransferase [Acidimicrobiia bacterium]